MSSTFPLRRSHKKSRNGCIECKRRHVKCDESLPKCVNCNVAGRDCTYAGRSPGPTRLVTESPPATPREGVASNDVQTGLGVSLATQLHHLRLPTSGSQAHNPVENTTVNIYHMELLINFSSGSFMPELEDTFREGLVKVAFKAGLEAPYLLYEMLAISARELSVSQQDKRQFHLDEAFKLQTKAISTFNTTNLGVDKSTCVPMLLFSSLLSRHFLTDMLAVREPDPNHFLEHYIRYVRLHRGIRKVAHDTWPSLLESELRSFLSLDSGVYDKSSIRHDCDELRQLLSASLNSGELRACDKTAHFLQLGFDQAMMAPQKGQYSMIFVWSVIVPEEFIDMVTSRKPEAIALLGYYAVLLHYSREMWQIGNAGVYFLDIITRFMGPDRMHWLTWPRDVISSDSTKPPAME